MDDKQVLAQNLKDLRVKMGISQRTLAKNLDIQPTAVSAYERGEKLPTAENLIKIADFFDVSTDELLGRERKSVKLDFITVVKALCDDYGFYWNCASKCFLPKNDDFYELLDEYRQLQALVIRGTIKADVLELWIKDKRERQGVHNDM